MIVMEVALNKHRAILKGQQLPLFQPFGRNHYILNVLQ